MGWEAGMASEARWQASRPWLVMVGHDDWSKLRIAVSDGGGAFVGPVPPGEVTDKQRQFMRDSFPDPVPEPVVSF